MNNKIRSLTHDFFQISSEAFIFFTGPIIASDGVVTFLQLIAIFILFEAAWEMRRTKYYRIPDVGKQHELVTSGIYRYVRNPMYLSQLLFFGILVAHSFSLLRLIVYFILMVNFVLKIRYEETLLHDHFREFEAYRKTSWKLLPFIY